jgi:hypothetical protein
MTVFRAGASPQNGAQEVNRVKGGLECAREVREMEWGPNKPYCTAISFYANCATGQWKLPNSDQPRAC